jgi:riboflavin transporter FmnP
MKFGVKKMATMAVLAALSIVLMLLIKFPIIPAASYLIYEPADVPIFIGAFLFGPFAGLLITVVVSAIQALMSPDGLVGFIMHVIATGTFVVAAGLIYKKFHNIKGAVVALVSGTLAMTLIMIPTNLVIQTHFRDMEFAAVAKLLVPVIIPFNLIKAGLNSIITFLVYKRISNIFHRFLKDTASTAPSSGGE